MATSEIDLAATRDGPDVEAANKIVSPWTLKYIYIGIGSVGLAGNIFVLIVLNSDSIMRKILTNIFIMSQSFLDGFVAFFLILTSVFEDTGTWQSHVANEIYCRMWLTKLPLWGLLVSSTYNLLSLTLERYLAIVHPVWHKNKFNRKKVRCCIAAAWVTGIVYNALYMIPSSGMQMGGSCSVFTVWPSEPVQRLVGVLTIVVQFFLPIGIFAFCYIRMWRVLKSKMVQVLPNANQSITVPRKDGLARARRNIIKTLMFVVCFFLLCWTWNQIYYLLFNLGYAVDFTSSFYHFTVIMVFCNCCINPFIYIVKYEHFKKAARNLFCRTKSNSTTSKNDPTKTTELNTQYI